jgi:Flp pilus assembly pilin Flp
MTAPLGRSAHPQALAARPATHPPAASERSRRGNARRGERGQSTVEYALLLLGAAAIALVLVAWVTRTDLIGRLFDTVVGRILQQAG